MSYPHRCGAAGLALLAACHPTPPETPLPTAPLLETLPASYRPINRQDTLRSAYLSYAALADTSGTYHEPERRQVLVRARFVPASAMQQAGRDTLTFRHPYNPRYPDGYTGYAWEFAYLSSRSARGRRIPPGGRSACASSSPTA